MLNQINDYMSILTVHIGDEKQTKAVKAILDAMELKYEEETDTTEYLLADPAMKLHLEKSIEEMNQDKATPIRTEDLWK